MEASTNPNAFGAAVTAATGLEEDAVGAAAVEAAAVRADAAFPSKVLLLVEVQNFSHSEKSWKWVALLSKAHFWTSLMRSPGNSQALYHLIVPLVV